MQYAPAIPSVRSKTRMSASGPESESVAAITSTPESGTARRVALVPQV